GSQTPGPLSEGVRPSARATIEGTAPGDEAADAGAGAARVERQEGHLVELLLVRHAIAFNRDPDRWPHDGDRSLTPQGEARFRKAARGLKAILPSVELVLSSPYARAWRTAEILSEETGWPDPKPSEALEAERSRSDAMGVLRSEAGRASVALV